jgi:hypothetical protein
VQSGQTIAARRRLSQPVDGIDDPIEFESPKSGRLH